MNYGLVDLAAQDAAGAAQGALQRQAAAGPAVTGGPEAVTVAGLQRPDLGGAAVVGQNDTAVTIGGVTDAGTAGIHRGDIHGVPPKNRILRTCANMIA